MKYNNLQLWQATHHKHIEINSLMANGTLDESLKELKLMEQKNRNRMATPWFHKELFPIR